MRIVTYKINYGGYIGAEDTYQIEVEDDATEEDIEDAVEEDYKLQIADNCYYEIEDVEDAE